MRIPSLRQEDPLEKERTTHSSILAWSIPWTEEPGRLQSVGSQREAWQRLTRTFVLDFISQMAPHSSALAWGWTEEPGGLQSTGLQRVGHDWATSHNIFKIYWFPLCYWVIFMGLPGGDRGKEPACQSRLDNKEMRIWSLGWEDPLEEGMAAHSSILSWRTPWTEEPDGPQSMGSQRVR